MLLLNSVAIGCYGFLFVSVKTKNEHASKIVNDIDAESTAESAKHSRKTLVAETAQFREKIQKYIVGKEEAVSFFELLERTGEERGVKVSIESVTKGELTQVGIEELHLTLKVVGTWAGVVRYIGLLELLPLEAKVKQLVIARAEREGEGPWSSTVTLSVLKMK